MRGRAAETARSRFGKNCIGAHGAFLTHLAALRDARDRGHGRIMVLEDDCDFTAAIDTLLPAALDMLDARGLGIFYGGYVLPDGPNAAAAAPLMPIDPARPVRTAHCVGFGRVAIEGLESRDAWRTAIVEESGSLDTIELEADVVAAARAFVVREPAVGAIVFDCADLPPYGPAVQAATGLPVFDALMLADLLHASTNRGSGVPSLD